MKTKKRPYFFRQTVLSADPAYAVNANVNEHHVTLIRKSEANHGEEVAISITHAEFRALKKFFGRGC